MPAETMRACRAVLRRRRAAGALICLMAGLGSLAGQAPLALAAPAGAPAVSAGPITPVTAYVADGGGNTVIPIPAATNSAGTRSRSGTRPMRSRSRRTAGPRTSPTPTRGR